MSVNSQFLRKISHKFLRSLSLEVNKEDYARTVLVLAVVHSKYARNVKIYH